MTIADIQSRFLKPIRDVELDRKLELNGDTFRVHADSRDVRFTNESTDVSFSLEWAQFEALSAEAATMKRILESAQKEI